MRSTTLVELPNIRVKRKVAITIPVDLRRQLQIREGSVLEVRERGGGILLKPTAPVEAGYVVGERTHEEIMHDLDHIRKKWR